jgi:hypothetical protein
VIRIILLILWVRAVNSLNLPPPPLPPPNESDCNLGDSPWAETRFRMSAECANTPLPCNGGTGPGAAPIIVDGEPMLDAWGNATQVECSPLPLEDGGRAWHVMYRSAAADGELGTRDDITGCCFGRAPEY